MIPIDTATTLGGGTNTVEVLCTSDDTVTDAYAQLTLTQVASVN